MECFKRKQTPPQTHTERNQKVPLNVQTLRSGRPTATHPTPRPETEYSGRAGEFKTTHWSLLLTAYHRDTAVAAVALNRLCQSYWYPVYVFIRRRGHAPDESSDLTQEFFAELLEKNVLLAADRERGRFRSFLLASVKNFLSHQREKARAQKRGGEYVFVPLDSAEAEGYYSREPADPLTPEKLFERRWALTVLEQTFTRLRNEYVAAGKGKLFEALEPCFTGDDNNRSYAEIGVSLNLSEGAARVAAHRLRSRFTELLRFQVAQTVADPAEVEDELAALRAALA
jgi:RNA polymerase sigma-70 factor (ECF subfamily)